MQLVKGGLLAIATLIFEVVEEPVITFAAGISIALPPRHSDSKAAVSENQSSSVDFLNLVTTLDAPVVVGPVPAAAGGAGALLLLVRVLLLVESLFDGHEDCFFTHFVHAL